ncbi:protein white isoform X1 [Dermatophagoides farinae]|uniref:ATPase n=2 Tax=Dermatophagoides farinae TaxID=6954 RepID=A0A922HZ52_DERFA|nr:protein white-like [Dermatophagoides farinae]KAH7645763.1 protein white-like [Dermatophagoides farinae]KAH9515955.1 ATPase [Dermatophagoides farinae]
MEQNLIEMNQKIQISKDENFGANLPTAELSWHQISVWVRSERRSCFRRRSSSTQILDSVSGNVKPGQLLAIMGPSGSGKTTLLNTLTGRNLSQYNYEGVVLINRHRAQIDTIKSLSGYVQQGDLFVPMLTVKEYLIFMSLVRMDRNKCSDHERKRRIDEIISELELTNCANSRIGNRYDDIIGSGISTGECRRLSFAAEMLTNPSLLFCDEPTSGLDSYLAESVVKILKKMAQSGRTIICTIHQPSSEVFILFDKILLLTQGKLAFIGTSYQANEFFTSLGFICPLNFNPADYFLRQISIIPGSKDECLQQINRICSEFKERENDELKENHLESSTEMIVRQPESIIYKASWMEQFHALLWRSFISNVREPMITRIKFSQTLTVALLLGIVYWRQQLDQKGIMNINGAIFILIINLTFMNVFSVINTFCSELPIFLREYNNGMYRVDTYFLAKMFSELPYQIIFPTILVALLYYMVGFNNTWNSFIMFIFISNLIANCGISFGYMISCLSSSTKMAIALSSPLILPLLLFGGFFINNSTIPVYFKLFKYISWFYYGNEALIITQWINIENITCTTQKIYDNQLMNSSINEALVTSNGHGGEQRCLTKGISVIEELSFDPSNLYIDIIALILLIIAMRFLAYMSLSLKSRIR